MTDRIMDAVQAFWQWYEAASMSDLTSTIFLYLLVIAVSMLVWPPTRR